MSVRSERHAGASPSAKSGYPLRASFKSGARVHVDRIQPFLIVHRKPHTGRAHLAEGIALASGAYYLHPYDGDDEAIASLLAVYQSIANRFGTILIIDISECEPDDAVASDSPEVPLLRLRIRHSIDKFTLAAVEKIAECLQHADLEYRRTVVDARPIERDVTQRGESVPIHESAGLIRLVIPSVYCEVQTGTLYPELMERIVAAVYDSLLQGVFAFSRAARLETPPHHRGFGRSVLQKVGKHVDREIGAICRSFDFLLSVTPINAEDCWHRFDASGFEAMPRFRYRPLPISTDVMKRKLHAIDVDAIEDPVLIEIFREKQRELDQQLTMLQLRETPKFKQAGILVYGNVSSTEDDEARSLLDLLIGRAPPSNRDDECHDCYAIEAAALEMIDRYRLKYAAFNPGVLIRDDLPAGLMVSAGNLLISRHTRIPRHRLHALLSHEIGVHLLTYFAGMAQPLRIFGTGLAGYEGMQEGLGIFAEYVCDSLTNTRLRVLAGRVIACRSMLDGASFIETFRLLEETAGLSPRAAFNIALRAHRSGGLAKDAIYLRGFATVLELLRNGKSLDVFWLGKIAPHHVGAIEELIHRDLLTDIPIRPEFMSERSGLERIALARTSGDICELLAT